MKVNKNIYIFAQDPNFITENENLLSKYNPNKNKPIFKDFIIALIENRAQEIGIAIYNIQNGCFLISQVFIAIHFYFYSYLL